MGCEGVDKFRGTVCTLSCVGLVVSGEGAFGLDDIVEAG